VSQPTNRQATIPLPGKLDNKLKEFWADNPWRIVAGGHNLSSFERNRFFLNRDGVAFLEASHISGTDSDGDGRAAVAADLFHSGKMDLIVRQSGGGPLLVYENQFSNGKSLQIRLAGKGGSRQGIGARVTAEFGGKRVVRENYPSNTYASQTQAIIHIGTGDEDLIKRLQIRWPSGTIQTLENVPAGGLVEIREGEAGFAPVQVE